MIKPRFVFLIILFVAAALYILNGSYVLLFPVMFLLLFAAAGDLTVLFGGRKLEVDVQLPGSMNKQNPETAAFRVRNRSLIPVFYAELGINWKNTLTGEHGKNKMSFAVLPLSEATIESALRVNYCGAYQLTVAEIRVYDLFHLFRAKRKTEGQGEILVYPKTERVQLPMLSKDIYDMESFRYSQIKKGDDPNETFDIREYMAGDSIRKIHWKLTGKMDQIMIRESSYPIFHSLLLLLETGFTKLEESDAARMDASVSVFLSLAEMLLEQNTPFGIGFYDYNKNLFCTERIESSEALWNLVPDLLRAGRAVSSYTAYEQYQMNFGDCRYAHYIYVTAEDGRAGADAYYPDQEAMTVFACADTFLQEEREIRFTVKNWKEELA